MSPAVERLTIPVLGHPTTFESNSPEVLAVARESFGPWIAAEVEEGAVRLTVHIVVCDDDAASHDPLRHHLPDAERLLVHSRDCLAVADPARREAYAVVTPALVARRSHFRTELLEAVTLALVSAFDRHPVHAAALLCGDRALLLSAPSGTGKSTLAYVARRAGITVLSEDRVWVQHGPALRVWGWPGDIHLRDGASARFPELATATPRPYRHGPPRIAVAGAPAALCAARVGVCAVTRCGAGRPVLARASRDELGAALARDVAPGFDRFPARHHDTVRAITAHGGWRLELSDDPHAALPLLQQMLADPD